MSIGLPIVGSMTQPVQEVIRDNENGLLVDFFSTEALVESVTRILTDRQLATRLGAAARSDIIKKYSLKQCVSRQLALIELIAAGDFS